MKKITWSLLLLSVTMTSAVIAQKKGEMPFTSSAKNANKSMRNAWVALADFKLDEGNNYMRQVLNEDPECGMCYASLFPFDDEEAVANLKKAASMKLSEDERLLIEGVIAQREDRPNESYFEPLIKKYPSDSYLQLWIMLNNSNRLRAIELGEDLIKRNAKLAPAYNLMGYLHMFQKDMKKAEMYFDRYIALQPNLANPYDSKGDFYMEAGDGEKAVAMYEKAIAMGMTESAPKLEAAKTAIRFPKPTANDASALEDIINDALTLYKNHDVRGFTKDYSEQCLNILADQKVHVGAANIRRAASEYFKYFRILNNQIDIEAVQGVGSIAVAYGVMKSSAVEKESGTENQQKWNTIFLFSKDSTQQWKVLTTHAYDLNGDSQPLTREDRININKLFAAWDASLPIGQTLTDAHFDDFAKLYSSQAIEIYPNHVSNVALPNLRARWKNFPGSIMETNVLRASGVEGLGRRAVAWGVAVQAYRRNDSDQLHRFEFPWAMILTKEQDDVWRILTIHWSR